MYDFRSIVGLGAQTQEEIDYEISYANGINSYPAQGNKPESLYGKEITFTVTSKKFCEVSFLEEITLTNNFSRMANEFLSISQGMVKFTDDVFRLNDIQAPVLIKLYNFSSPYIKDEAKMENVFYKHISKDEVK